MYTIQATNINHAVNQGFKLLVESGQEEASRNGSVIVMDAPVMTTYLKPKERVIYSPTRDANPFFHLMESLWMLAGRNDLAFPLFFNSKFASYSDDGAIVHGAYGHRWRVLFGMDQLAHLADELRNKPNTRRAVLEMWSALGDLTPIQVKAFEADNDILVGGLEGRDVPCNTHAYFDLRGGVLNMTVCNRSNDAVWGAYGANAVHFSVMQEYLAAMVGVQVGVYRQFSNNFHAYTDIYSKEALLKIAEEALTTNHYIPQFTSEVGVETVEPYPLVSTSIEAWNADLRLFMRDPGAPNIYNDDFFNSVAYPMFCAWRQRKAGEGDGMEHAVKIAAKDWKLACVQWINRRAKGA